MKLHIPKTFRLGAHLYRVRLEQGLEDAGQLTSNDEVLLDPDQSESNLQDTFLHEVIEAIDTLRELDLEHRTIQILATDLLQVLGTMRGRLLSAKSSHQTDKSNP